MPAYVVRWRYGFYPTTLLEHAIVATVVVFAIEAWRAQHAPAWRTPFTLPALLFVAAGAISVLTAPSLVAALGLYRAYILEPIAFAFVLINVLDTLQRALAVLAGLAVAGLWLALPNAALVLGALLANRYSVLQTPPVLIYITANAVALYLGPLIGVAAGIALHSRSTYPRAAAVLFLVGAVPAMLLTFSRGGYVAMAAVAVVLALSHRRRWVLLAGELILGATVLAVPPIFHRVALEFQNVEGTTFFGRAGRLELWQATLQMLRAHALFGAGLSGFADRVAPFWNANHPERFVDPHNIVLNFWVETGLLGLLAFGWILLIAFRVGLAGWRRAPAGWREVELGVVLALVAIVVHGLVDVPYFKNDLSLEFWTLVALAWTGASGLAARSKSPAVHRSRAVL